MNRPRGAVFVGPGQPLVMQDFDCPELAAGEALVEVLCCTLCGSDLHTIQGKREVAGPMILGHEVIGRLIETNGHLCAIDGGPLRPGDRISWGIAASCHDCFFCQSGLPQKCEQLFKYGHQSITSPAPLSGGLATHCHLVAGTSIIKVPDSLPDWVACPANCATATIAGALRTAGSVAGSHLLVQGAGMLGLTAAAMASAAGAASVVVTDISPERLERVKQFGADHVVLMDGQENKLAEIVAELTGGHGMDVAIDVCGAVEAVQAGLDSLRIGGIQVLVGSVFPGPPLALNMEDVVRRMLTIRGLHNYTPADLAAAVDFLDQHHQRFPFSDLITGSYLLSDVTNAFSAAADPRSLRIAIEPSA